MPTPPGPEISPFTAQELDDFERDLMVGSRVKRLCAMARRGLEADRWKNSADLAFAGEEARSRQLNAVTLERDALQHRMGMLAARVLRHQDAGGIGAATHAMNGPMGTPRQATEGWLAVTRQLVERVAKLEMDRRAIERVAARAGVQPEQVEVHTVRVDGQPAAIAADMAVYGHRVDMGPLCPETGVYVSRCVHCGAEPLNAEVSAPEAPARASFADIAKSPEFATMVQENIMRDMVLTDRNLRALLGDVEFEVMQRRLITGGPRICDGADLATAVGTLERVAKVLGSEATSPDELVLAAARSVIERDEARAWAKRVQPLLEVTNQREADALEYAQTVEALRAEILESQRQLTNALADNENIRATREAVAHRAEELAAKLATAEGVVEAGEKFMASISYMLRVERGEHVGQTRDRIAAKLDELLAARDDLARRIRESDSIQGMEDLQGDHDWDTPKERLVVALEQARAKGRRDADVERAALVAKLALVREALGATLGADGSDDVVDRARQLPRVADLAGALAADEWRQWMLSVASFLGLEGDPANAGETFGRVRDKLAALAAEGGRWQGEYEALKAQLDPNGGSLTIKASPVPSEAHRPGHARVSIQIWPSPADVPMFDRPTYAVCVDMGADSLAKFQANASYELAKLLATWGEAGEAQTISPAPVESPDPGKFAADLAAQVKPDTRLASGLAPLFELDANRLDGRWSAAEQVLHDVMAAARSSQLAHPQAGAYSVKHRPADAAHPPRTELHVYAPGQLVDGHVLAYVELGELWLVTLDGSGAFRRAHHLAVAGAYRWSERISFVIGQKPRSMEALPRRPRRQYKTSDRRRKSAMERRDRLSQDENGVRIRCINENQQGTHGPPTHGCRCAACHETYKRTAA